MLLLALLLAVTAGAAPAVRLQISNQLSPLDRFREKRPRTEYIILHTTEGGGRSSLEKVRRGGLAHYLVRRDGRVQRIIQLEKVAQHTGRSMWNGAQNLDRRAIGIEVVGYHDRPVTDQQVAALKELLRQLQGIYRIPDERVLTHSMVAYGKPNRWHRKSHRGRKRCGMQFADPALRARLGLDRRPLFDPDVRAGRLIEADPYLAAVLYRPEGRPPRQVDPDPAAAGDVITARRSAWDIAREDYDAPSTVYVYPGGRQVRGHQVDDWSRLAKGTRVLLDQPLTATPPPGVADDFLTLAANQAASRLAGKAYDDYFTVYLLPGGRVRRGDSMDEGEFRGLPPGTRIFLGYEYAGQVTPGITAYSLCGADYKRPTTVYVLPAGQVVRGDEIREDGIPAGTLVLVKS